MEMAHWITITALSLLLAEGCMLSLFPEQVKQLLVELEPRYLQWAGLSETVVAAALLAALLLG